MKRVVRTKEPSIKQLSNMSWNLREKYSKVASVELKYISYTHINKQEEYFWISVESYYGQFHKSWQEVQDVYFNLMEGSDA